jgi:membrane-associated phospholipid phosphatase
MSKRQIEPMRDAMDGNSRLRGAMGNSRRSALSLRPSPDDQGHEAGDHDDSEDRQPYAAVSTHPAEAVHVPVHHVRFPFLFRELESSLRRRAAANGAAAHTARRPAAREVIAEKALRPWIGALVLIGAAWLFGGVVQDLHAGDPLTIVDVVLGQWLHDNATPLVTGWMLLVTGLHGAAAISLYVLGVALYLARRKDWYWLSCLVVIVPTGMAVNVALKLAFRRERPAFDDPLVTLSSYSFPSGHVAGATLFYGVVCAMLLAKTASRRLRALIVLAALAMIATVAFTRLYLGAHFLSDVIGSFAAALAWIAACLLAMHHFEERLHWRAAPPPR